MFDTTPYELKMVGALEHFEDELKKGTHRQGAPWNARKRTR